jgi:protoporphyrinogen/coproporphyrinogen III oxidase
MKKKHVIVLGAGVSGLCAAWFLSRNSQPVNITLLEKTERAGGLLHTEYTPDFLFEKGARLFRTNKSPELLKIVEELGLESQIISCSAKQQSRYAYQEGKLRRFPSNPLSFCFSSLTRHFVLALLSEWKKPVKYEDETVWEFVHRRLGSEAARHFFDPLVVGIFGGDIRQISIRACFPLLKRFEEQNGSILNGMIHHYRAQRKMPKTSSCGLARSSIFSFKKGVQQFVDRLLVKSGAECHFGQEVQRIAIKENRVEVVTQDRVYYADALICALALKESTQLLDPLVPEISRELLKTPTQGMAVVNIGYKENVLPLKGLGYLIGKQAQEEVLGVLFDSSFWKEQNQSLRETRLTVNLEERGREESWYIQTALKSLKKHLDLSATPSHISFKRILRAIPQYGPGHFEKIKSIKEELKQRLPRYFLAGNYLVGVSVEECIVRAKEVATECSALLCNDTAAH